MSGSEFERWFWKNELFFFILVYVEKYFLIIYLNIYKKKIKFMILTIYENIKNNYNLLHCLKSVYILKTILFILIK